MAKIYSRLSDLKSNGPGNSVTTYTSSEYLQAKLHSTDTPLAYGDPVIFKTENGERKFAKYDGASEIVGVLMVKKDLDNPADSDKYISRTPLVKTGNIDLYYEVMTKGEVSIILRDIAGTPDIGDKVYVRTATGAPWLVGDFAVDKGSDQQHFSELKVFGRNVYFHFSGVIGSVDNATDRIAVIKLY